MPTVDGKHYAESNGMTFIEASAKENRNVLSAFKSLGHLAVQRQVILNPQDASATNRAKGTQLDKGQSKLSQKKKSCC